MSNSGDYLTALIGILLSDEVLNESKPTWYLDWLFSYMCTYLGNYLRKYQLWHNMNEQQYLEASKQLIEFAAHKNNHRQVMSLLEPCLINLF